MKLTSYFGFRGVQSAFAQKALLAKKIMALIFSAIISVVYFIPWNKSADNLPFINYFNSYPSAQVFNEVKLTQQLPEGVRVASYDTRYDVFITCQNLFDGYNEYLKDFYSDEQLSSGETYLFGFASKDKVLIPPTYLNVVAISGDYAIVVKPHFPSVNSEFKDMETKIGIVKFRGENPGDRTDFKSDYYGITESLLSISQMQFVGDRYIAIINDKDNMDFTKKTVTFYDYKTSHKLLEVFKVRADFTYRFMLADNNLVAMTRNKAEFYRMNQIDEEGYLIINDTYKPFPEDSDDTLIDYMTTIVSYLGNNWFLRQGYIQANKEEFSPSDISFIEGKFILIDNIDSYTGNRKEYYLLMRSDRYNSGSKVSLTDSKLVPDMVANKYNEGSTRDIADYINNSLEKGVDNKFAYYPPSMPVGALPKDGMSIVYYYMFPYANQPERYVISFCMMDSNANIYHPKQNIFMPLLIIDDVAIQISDPDFEIAYGNAQIIDHKNNINVFKEYSYGEYGYINIAYNNGILIVAEYNLKEGSTEMFYGAFNREGKQITHFKYLELSLFYGDYAIGMNKVNDEFRYYRIDKNGNETRLNDVLAIRNGVYVTISDSKVGLKNYQGKVLLNNEYETIDVLETFLVDGKFQKTVVTALKDNVTYIYTLE